MSFQIVSFKLGGEEYGIEVLKVQEIIELKPITIVPRSPEFVKGIINLRGHVVPVIDLRTRLGLPVKEVDTDTKIVIVKKEVETEGQSKIEQVGLIVDSVSEVNIIEEDWVEPAPNFNASVHEAFIDGIAKLNNERLLILLNIDNVLKFKLNHLGEEEAGEE